MAVLSFVFTGLTGFTPLAVTLFSLLMAFLVVPCLFLHLEYLLANAGLEVEVNRTGIQVTKGGAVTREVDTEQIERISLYVSPKLRYGPIHFASEYYFYARIVTRDSKPDIIITSLMTNEEFDDLSALWKVKTENKKALFPSIRFPVVLPALQ
jgi:hypothetical protein